MAELNVEVMHLYAHELMRPKVAREAAERAYGYLPATLKTDYVLCALIDDYGSELTVSHEEAAETLIWYAGQEEMVVDYVAFESDCVADAYRLMEQAGIPAADLNGERHFRRETEQSSTAVLVSSEEYVACPTLAATWMLARLGTPNYTYNVDLYGAKGRVDTADGFVGERLLTILPLKYIRTESTVYELLRATQHDIREKIHYVFY